MINLSEIIDSHKSKLISIIYKWCKNREDMEDILQNIFKKLHLNHSEFRGDAKIDTWLYRVAVNESIDYYRSNKRFRMGRVDVADVQLVDKFGNPEEDAHKLRLKLKLEDIICELEEQYKAVFSLYFIGDLSITEISNSLNISKNAVRCRIYKAKQIVMEQATKKGILLDGM